LRSEEPVEPEEPPNPNFDGGARQSPPPPDDPEADHDQTVLEIARRAKWGEW